MATSTANKRLRQDYLRLQRDPVPYVEATPLPSNILEWHYVVKGPEDTPYYGGYYHGKLIFPKDYPFKPPRIIMLTPNGRFQTNTRLCLSISDFHPDSWNPAWSVATILTGLLSFMVEKTATLGSIETTTEVKRQLAVTSWSSNLRNQVFCQLFPHICEEIKQRLEEHKRQQIEQQGSVQHSVTTVLPSPGQTNIVNHGYCSGVFANIILFLTLAVFVFVVKVMIESVA